MRRISTFLAGLLVAGAAVAGPLPSSASLAILQSSDRIDVHLSVISSDATLPDRWMELRQALGGAFDVPADRVNGQLLSGAATLGLSIEPGADGSDRVIDLTPILSVLGRLKQPVLQVAVMLPDVDGTDCSLSAAERTLGARWFREEIRTDDPAAEIVLTFATTSVSPREPGDPAQLLILLGVPTAVFAWAWLVRRRAARTVDDAEPLVASYWRFHHLHLLATLTLWLAAFSVADVGPFVAGWFPGATAGARLLRWTALYALPPAAIALLAQAITRPALMKLQSLGWPGVELYRQSGSLHLLPHVVLMCGLCGLVGFYETGNVYTAVALLFIGLLVYLTYIWGLRRTLVLTPHAISTGELHDRVAELAKRFRVAVPLVSLLPSGRSELANAFAVPGRGVWISESLLRTFSRREVDAIVAHELAHFRQFRRRSAPAQTKTASWVVYVVSLVGMMMYLLTDPTFAFGMGRRPIDLSRWAPVGFGLLLVGGRLALSRSKRRNEYEADRHAVEVTGDAPALISGLTRLHRLAGTPLSYTRLEEYFSTHPSTTRRVAALARQGGLTRAEVAELVRDEQPHGDGYPIPATATEGNLVFSSAFRSSYMNRMSWTITAIMIAIPMVAALLTQVLSDTLTGQAVVLAGGVVATFVAYFEYVRRLRAAGWARLRRGLREKLRPDFGDAELAGGSFVNFAPGDVPKLHESFPQWDIGYLFLGDRLVYVGEQVRFTLRPDQVVDLHAGQGLPGWTRRDHVYLTWREPSVGRAGTFRIWPGEISRDGYQTDVHRFEERIHAWRAGKVKEPIPDALTALGPPELGDVHGVRPKSVGSVQSFSYSLAFVGLLAAGVCVLLGLSFDPEELAGAWYVQAVAAIVLVINILPYWRAKEPEPPVVTAAPATS
jgi:heat shock protein HtpX